MKLYRVLLFLFSVIADDGQLRRFNPIVRSDRILSEFRRNPSNPVSILSESGLRKIIWIPGVDSPIGFYRTLPDRIRLSASDRILQLQQFTFSKLNSPHHPVRVKRTAINDQLFGKKSEPQAAEQRQFKGGSKKISNGDVSAIKRL